MTPAARISAAIEVLDDIIQRRRPASDALKDWGLSRRFAGSKDRAAIASLVYDALRRKASSAFAMASDEPRALVLGMLAGLRGLEMERDRRALLGRESCAAAAERRRDGPARRVLLRWRAGLDLRRCARNGSGRPSRKVSARMP